MAEGEPISQDNPGTVEQGGQVQIELTNQEKFNIDTANFLHEKFPNALEKQEDSSKLTYPEFFGTGTVDAAGNVVAEGLAPEKVQFIQRETELFDEDKLREKGLQDGTPMMRFFSNIPQSKEIILDKTGVRVVASPGASFAYQEFSLLRLPKNEIKVFGEFLKLIDDEKKFEAEEKKAAETRGVGSLEDLKNVFGEL